LVRAKEWGADRRDNSSLLRGNDLKEAEAWLATAAHKEPAPTDLHVEYLLASRKAARRRQRWLIGSVSFALLVALTLGFVAWNRARIAEQQREEADKQKKAAELQGRLALARRLVSQAQVIKNQEGNLLELAVLLTLESMTRFPSLEGDQFLRENLKLLTPRIASLTNQSEVSLVRFTPDEKYLVTVLADDTVQVWDFQTSRKLTTIKPQPHRTAITLSIDGKYISTGAQNGTVEIWNTINGSLISTIKHNGAVRGIAFSPDSTHVASGTAEDQLTVSETNTGHEITKLTTDGGIVSVAFSPDGKFLAAATGWGSINVWDSTTYASVTTMQPEIADVVLTQLVFSPDGKRIASAGFSSVENVTVPAQIWDVSSGHLTASVKSDANIDRIVFSREGKYLAAAGGKVATVCGVTGDKIVSVKHQSDVEDLAFSPDGNYLVTGSNDNSAAVWEIPSGREVIRLRHGASVQAVAFSPQGRYVATGSEDKTAAVWTLPPTRKAIKFGDTPVINSAIFSPDGRYLATGATESEDQDMARIWETNTGRFVTSVKHDHQVYASSFYGNYVATASGDRTVRIWELPEGRELRHLDHDAEVRAVAFSSDGRYLATGTSGGGKTVRIWDVGTGSLIKQFDHDSAIESIVFSKDGTRLVSSSSDNTIRVWSVATGQEVMRLQQPIAAVALNADGTLLATGGFDVTVWEIASKRNIPVIKNQTEEVRVLRFSPDGNYLATAGANTVRVWELNSGDPREVARMPQSDYVFDVNFGLDGEFLAIASGALSVQLEHWRPSDMIAEGCARVSRNLNADEWKKYFGDETYHATCPQFKTQQ
jgi:WD40 repeat protein